MQTKNYFRIFCSAVILSGSPFYMAAGQATLPLLPLKHGDSLELPKPDNHPIPLVHPKPGPKDTLHPILIPGIHAGIKSIEIGDTLMLKIDAPVTSSFKLFIYGKPDSLISSRSVKDGITILPALSAGHYHFTLSGDSDKVVSKGAFEVRSPEPSKPPKLESPKPVHPKPVEVKVLHGDTLKLWINSASSSLYTLNIFTHKDSLIASVAINGGTTVLSSLPEGHYDFELVGDSNIVAARGKFDLPAKHPKPEAPKPVHPKPLEVKIKTKDSLVFWIGSPVSETYTLRILSHKDSLLSTASVHGGSNYLTLIPGHYHYELIGDSGIVVKKGKFDFHVPRLKSIIAPNPSAGEGTITLDAPVTEKFELNIYSPSALVSSTQISGGTTVLPLLSSGLYYYKVLDSNNNIVSHGRISLEK